MILTIDVHYKTDYAKTVLLFFENWQSETPINVITHITKDVLDMNQVRSTKENCLVL
ncbi:hypothetical protein [Flavobacterium sp. HNIBRBA15423]|uniref:hypothetical protein n=1 Tax=Flavobacterium sp. HNIBRBA15423 TaxID=3458683 RepID=UPI0040447FFA